MRALSSALVLPVAAAVGILAGLDELAGDEPARVEHREDGEEGRELAADRGHEPKLAYP